MIGARELDAQAFVPVDENDRTGAREISLTAFAAGFFFSFRAILVLISARWLHLGTEPGVITSLTIEFSLLLFIAFQAMGPGMRPIGWIMRLPSVRWVFLFLAFSCSSLLWSGTISRSASFLYWCGMAADVAIVVFLLRTCPVGEASHSLLRGSIWSTCILAVIAWIMPTEYDLRLGDQDYFNTNQIGNLCAMAIFMAQFLVSRKDGKWKPALFLLTVTLLRSLSKATIIAFVLGETFLIMSDRSLTRKTKALILCAVLVLVSIFWGLIGSYFDSYTTTGNQAETLTGRTTIWAYTLGVSLEKPWIGNGIDAMWKVFPPFGREMFEARHAENELLQQFFAYGVAGIVMLIAVYGSLYRRILTLPKGSSKAILIAIMLFIFIRGLVEAEPFDLLLPLWMITMISCIVDAARMGNETKSWTTPMTARMHGLGSFAGGSPQ